MLFGSNLQLKKLEIDTVKIGDSTVKLTEYACNIGVTLDKTMSMELHVKKIVSSAWYHLRNIYRIRKFLTRDTTKILVHAFITSKLDSYNCLLYGSKKLIDKLQVVQNKAAKLVVNAGRLESSTEIRRSLNWLPVLQRIDFKILLYTYKALNGLAPLYITNLLKVRDLPCQLRNRGIVLEIPKTKKKTQGDRAFSSAGPVLWNKLPMYIRNSDCIEQFKKHLKHHLFQKAYKV